MRGEGGEEGVRGISILGQLGCQVCVCVCVCQYMYLQDGSLGVAGLSADLGGCGGKLGRRGEGGESLHRVCEGLCGQSTGFPVAVREVARQGLGEQKPLLMQHTLKLKSLQWALNSWMGT